MTILQKIANWFKSSTSNQEPPVLQHSVQETEPTPDKAEKTNAMNDDQLSKNFKLSEFTKSQTASRKKIDNTPSPEHLENIKTLVDNFLQLLRDDLGVPIFIRSGYRSPTLNHAIGGASDSQHTKGEAVDIECSGMSNVELANYIKENYDFDQLILEFYNPDEGPNSGWVHVSYKATGNRKEVLSALTDGKNTRYVYGIAAD